MTEIIVLGAGPTGLMAALEAARAGHRCTVFEAADRVGGMAGSFEVAGQRVDFGSHRLHPAAPPQLRELISDLLGDDLQVRPRVGRLRIGGRWVGFPLRAGNLLSTLDPRLTAALVTDTAVRGARTVGSTGGRRGEASAGPPSFHEVVTARFGPTVAGQFYGPYARKLYGIDPSELDGELARRRISASSPTDIARRLIRARRPEGRTFLYPRRGYGQIVERLAEAAEDAGATIELGSPVTAIGVEGGGVGVSVGGCRYRAPVALSTIPLPRLAGMLDPPPPPAVVAALSRVRTRAMVLVYLVLDQPQYTPFDAHYLPGLDTSVARLSEPKNYRRGDDPADRTVLCAEIPCWAGDQLWRAATGALGELVGADLARVGLPPVRPVEVEIRRLESAYPVYDRAGAADRSIIDNWIRSPSPLLTVGRQGLGVVDNLHHVLAMGTEAVRAVGTDGTIDIARWHSSLDRFASNVVED